MKIQTLRSKIDRLDSRLLKLLNQRAKLSAAIGQCKLASGDHVYAPDREEHLLRTLEKKNAGPMPHGALRSIYREILSSSRACQSSLRVAALGGESSTAWEAARRRFGSSDDYRALPSLSQALSGLASGKIDIAVVDASSLLSFLWDKKGGRPVFSVCGDIILAPSNGSQARQQYFLLSKKPALPSAYSKTVFAMECPPSIKSVKEWRRSFSVLKQDLLHVEPIRWGARGGAGRWLVEIKGHWENDSLSKRLEPAQKMIRRSLFIGCYPEVPSHA